jgi:Uma2 family endonuclease
MIIFALNKKEMTQNIETSEKIYSVEEWLELEKISEFRHEYYYGKLITMAGVAKNANKISNNILYKLYAPLLEKGLDIYTHDIKTQVLENGIYRYPDLVVAPSVDDSHEYIVQMPLMLVEVSSEESKHRDSVKKLKEYRAIPTLWYYLIVNQNEMLIEQHIREEGGFWNVQYYTEAEDVIFLDRFGLSLKVEEVYSRVKLA